MDNHPEFFSTYTNTRSKRPKDKDGDKHQNKIIEGELDTKKNTKQNIVDQSSIKENKKPEDNLTQYSDYKILIILILILIPIVLGIISNRSKTESVKINWIPLKSKFEAQSSRTWNILKASTHHIITSEEPDRPAVILMVLPNKNSHPMALCLAQHFSHDLDKILVCHTTSTTTYPFIDGAEFVNENIEDQKLNLDQSIKTIVKDHNSVIISHLEKLYSETVMLFHGLCDTTEAKYKRIAVIFILETSYELKNEEQLASYLENLWSDIDPVKIKPLLARLANNVIFLNPDKNFKNC